MRCVLSRTRKPALTRRQERQYRAVLARHGADYNYPWPYIAKVVGEADAMCAYFFAKRWHGKNIDVRKLQHVVILCAHAKVAFMFARDIEGANIRKLQIIVMKNGSADLKRQFAHQIPGADVQWLEAMAAVQDVMEM